MRFAHIHAEKARFTVRELCETLDVSTSGYYAWANRRPGRSNRIAYGVRQREAVREAFLRSRSRYGSPRVHAELKARGHRMHASARRGTHATRWPRGASTQEIQGDHRLETFGPNCTGSARTRLHRIPAQRSLGRRRHRHRIARGLACSSPFSSTFIPGAESFFSSVKTELAIRQPIASFRVAQTLLAEYIEHVYNWVRLHSTAGYMSPVAYELRSRAATLAA